MNNECELVIIAEQKAHLKLKNGNEIQNTFFLFCVNSAPREEVGRTLILTTEFVLRILLFYLYEIGVSLFGTRNDSLDSKRCLFNFTINQQHLLRVYKHVTLVQRGKSKLAFLSLRRKVFSSARYEFFEEIDADEKKS